MTNSLGCTELQIRGVDVIVDHDEQVIVVGDDGYLEYGSHVQRGVVFKDSIEKEMLMMGLG